MFSTCSGCWPPLAKSTRLGVVILFSSGSSGALSRATETYGHVPWCYFQSRGQHGTEAAASRAVMGRGFQRTGPSSLWVTGRCGVWRPAIWAGSCSGNRRHHQQEGLSMTRLWGMVPPPASPHPPPSYHNYMEHAGGCCLADSAQGPGLGTDRSRTGA